MNFLMLTRSSRSMIMRRGFGGVLLMLALAAPGVCRAQIGETREQLGKRYGEAGVCDKFLPGQFDRLVDDYRVYLDDKLNVRVAFKDGRAVLFLYQHKDKTPMSKEEVFTVLSKAAVNKGSGQPDWQLVNEGQGDPRWRLGDGSAYAYYFMQPEDGGAPFVRVENAVLDAVYTKSRGMVPANISAEKTETEKGRQAASKAADKLGKIDIMAPQNTPTPGPQVSVQQAGDKVEPLEPVSSRVIKPATEPDVPLLRIYAVKEGNEESKKKKGYNYDEKDPLLEIFTVRDLVLAKDGKGVLIGMNAKDTRTFAAITHKYNGSILLLKAGNEGMEAMHISAPIKDGYIGFKYPVEEGMAKYLRKRFEIGEFKE